MGDDGQMPTVRSGSSITSVAGQSVIVEGRYQQEDVRMMQVNPPLLHLGHVVVLLDDGCRVFLYPPATPLALRKPDEIQRFEGRRVRVTEKILLRIPQEGTVQNAPCLVDVESITLAEPMN